MDKMLLVDSREGNKTFKMLDRLKVNYKKQLLPVGDFFDEETGVIVERKTIRDFVQSVRSGHLQKQIMQMEQFDKPFLIISGSLEKEFFRGLRNWTINHHFGAIASVFMRSKTRVFAVLNDGQLAKLVIKLIEKSNKGPYNIEETELLRKRMTEKNFRKRLLCSIHGVGVKRAEKLLCDEKISSLLDEIVERVKLYGYAKNF